MIINLRDPGMVLQVQPIDDCINQLKSERDYCEIIYLSPCGETLNQVECNRLSVLKYYIALWKLQRNRSKSD